MAGATLKTALMTSVYAGKTTKNYESATKHGLGTGSNGALVDYLYFSKPMPFGATVISAKLFLYTDSSTGTSTQTITVKRLKQTVSMTKVTYKTRPTSYYTTPVAATASRTAPFPASSEWVVDVSAQLQAVANGDPWYGWELTGTSTPNRNVYGPRYKTASLRPRLEVVWAMLPTSPASLSPGGGRLVGLTKPTLRATYTDVGADNPLSAVQVQRSDVDNTFSTVTWDSGVLPATSAQLDTASTTWPALTAGTVVWWQMRVQDVNGLWSPYSTPESFGYAPKSTVTLTSPAAAPNNVVNDDSPPITWTFTGTQTAYQVTLLDPVTGNVRWTSGKVTSAATNGFSLPSGYLTDLTGTYRVTVYVWDDKQRETTPGDPAYSQATQDFTYALTNTVTPTTSMVATPDPVRPRVDLSWSRSSFPDTFTILRNGIVIAADLLAGDLTTGATTFAWSDPAPMPNTAATYQATAVVNGKSSSGNATSTVTVATQGVWLADYDRTNEVLIVGRESRSWTYGEQSEVLEVIGGTEVVVVTHAQRGLEGSISGQLRSNMLGLATTARQWKAALLAIKAKSGQGQTMWLTAGDATMPVTIRQINITPRPDASRDYDVSFEFYQLGAALQVASIQSGTGTVVVDANGIPYYSTTS